MFCMSLCLSVGLSQSGALQKRLNGTRYRLECGLGPRDDVGLLDSVYVLRFV